MERVYEKPEETRKLFEILFAEFVYISLYR